MGKRKDESTEDEINVDSIDLIRQKKHKKHKHKKHKKKKSLDKDDSPEMLAGGSEERKRQLKMKIKQVEEVLAQKKLLASSAFTIGHDTNVSSSTSSSKDKTVSTSPPKSCTKKLKKGKGKDSGTSSEEERWLDAIESGKLEEVDDELMKIKPKDPKLMTARQRAMLGRKSDGSPSAGITAPPEELLALPSGYKERVMTAEMVQKAALKSQRRKQQADEKREKDKKKTMERLLRKQESKSKSTSLKGRSRKHIAYISYLSTRDSFSLSFPRETDVCIKPTLPGTCTPPRGILCAVSGCQNAKRYCCSKTGIPLCSLECYRRNLSGTGLGEEYS